MSNKDHNFGNIVFLWGGGFLVGFSKPYTSCNIVTLITVAFLPFCGSLCAVVSSNFCKTLFHGPHLYVYVHTMRLKNKKERDRRRRRRRKRRIKDESSDH